MQLAGCSRPELAASSGAASSSQWRRGGPQQAAQHALARLPSWGVRRQCHRCQLRRLDRPGSSRKSSSAEPGAPEASELVESKPELEAKAEEQLSTSVSGGQTANFLVDGWNALPARSKIVVAAAAAFVFSNLDKVILSIAIIPMAVELGWSPSISGLVQSSFFWGYILVQLPGGYAVAKAGGRRILPIGVAVWSLATALLPFAATAVPTLCVSRAMVGLGEGIAPPSMTDIIAKVIPNTERSAAIARTFSGLHMGSIVALVAGPAIIKMLGWRSAFYIFGGAGLVWCVWWERILGETYDSGFAQTEKLRIDNIMSAEPAPSRSSPGDGELPWRAFLREPAVQGLMFVHFCNNWFHYTMLAWLPTFYIQTLDLDLIAASELSLLPPLAAFAGSNVAGPLADRLISEGTKVELVRKSMQAIAFVVPSILLGGAAAFDDQPVARIACITLALGFNSFSMAGLYSNHADLSPKHCSVLLGMTNTAGAVPGIVGVTFTGLVLERTSNWDFALFLPCIFFFMSGLGIYLYTGSSEQKAFENNQPFRVEQVFRTFFSRDNFL